MDYDSDKIPHSPTHTPNFTHNHTAQPAGKAGPGLGWAAWTVLPPRVARAWSPTEQVCSLSNGGHRSTRILIRENNNLSKIYMICVCFPDGISMGLIHQAGGLAGDPPEESQEGEARDRYCPSGRLGTRAACVGHWKLTRALASPETDCPGIHLTLSV